MSYHSKYRNSLLLLLAAVCLGACNKELDKLSPHNVNFEDQQFLVPNGYSKATIGNYTYFGASGYEVPWFNFSEFRGNNVKFIDITSTNTSSNLTNIDAFSFINSESKDFGYSNTFWMSSYQALLSVNTVLKHVAVGETNQVILQAKAENLFLRAFIYFNLVRLYGKPYYQSPETNLAVPLILEPLTGDATPPARNTVKDTYAQIIKDLIESIQAFNKKGVNSFASKYASYALLSRVYLYMSGPFATPATNYAQLSKQYADSVIINGGYTLLQNTDYINYYNNSNQANTETIWAINHDATVSNLTILLNQPAGTYAGSLSYSTGQVKPSPDLLSLLATGDLRKNFYKVDKYPGNNVDTFSTWKYYYKYLNTGVYYTYAPVPHLRLAEMYLNRAEAKVKSGDNPGALADLNIIHQRAGLTALTGLTGEALFNEILKERRLELAFEGHIGYDYFRNGLPMVRNYASFGSNPITVAATDPKVVLRISTDILAENGNIKQNVQ